MFRSQNRAIDYADLEYLACLADEAQVQDVIERLDAQGIPVRVQSVSVHSTDHPPNCRFQLFVPHDSIETASIVALNDSGAD